MNRLPEACGANSPWELTVDPGGAPLPDRSCFEQPFLIVGQDPGADLRLQHKDVSDRHAFLQWVEGRLHVLDLGSRTGVLYEGRRLRAGWLAPGQTIRIGPYRLGLATAPTPDTEGQEGPLPALALEIKVRGIRDITGRADGALSIVGSAPDCELRLLDPAISSYHAAVLNTRRGSWVIDLLGKGGIAVNGETVRAAALAQGDTVVIGRSIIRVATVEWIHAETNAVAQSEGEKSLEPLNGRAAPAAVPAEYDPGPAPEHPAPPPKPHLAAAREPEPVVVRKPEPVAVREPEPAPQPRRLGFFSPWRRTPVPARTVSAPDPADERDDSLPAAQPGWKQPLPAPSLWEQPAPAAARWEEPAASRSSRSAETAYESAPTSLDGSERRGSCRYSVPGKAAQISWRDASEPQDACRMKDAVTGSFRGQSSHATAEPWSDEGDDKEGPLNRVISVSMVDVSHAGLAVLSPVVPPHGERVWFRLDHEQESDWVELSAVGNAPAGSGHHLVRFAFRETCPYDLFKTLVFRAGPSRI